MHAIRLYSFSLLLLLAVACETGDPASPGFAGKPPVIVLDTLLLTDISPFGLPMYSGGLNLEGDFVGTRNGAVGSYIDPLFGPASAVHLMRPRLITKAVLDTINENTRIFLQIPSLAIEGDTLFPMSLELVEVTKPWRASNWTRDSTLAGKTGATLATFLWTNEDTMLVELPEHWKNTYRDLAYYNDADTLPRPVMHGLALRATSTAKMISIRSESMQLRLEHRRKVGTTTRDTTIFRSATMFMWATGIQTQLTPTPPDRFYIDNTFRHMLNFDIVATPEALGATNVLSAELVFYEDTTALQANIPPGNVRVSDSQMDIYYLSEREVRYDLTTVSPVFRAVRRRADGSFRVNLTPVLATQLRRKQQDALRFYMSYKSNSGLIFLSKGNDGTLYRTQLFSNTHPVKRPILILTKAVPDA